jgi:hypothetical protein
MFGNVELTENLVVHAALEAATHLIFEKKGGNLDNIRDDIKDAILIAYQAGYAEAAIWERSVDFERDFDVLLNELESDCEICLGLVDPKAIGFHSPLAVKHVSHERMKAKGTAKRLAKMWGIKLPWFTIEL